MIVAVVVLTVRVVPVGELVVAGVGLVDAVVVWRGLLRWGDGVGDKGDAVMLYYIRLSVGGPLMLLLAVRLRASGGRGTAPHVTSPTSDP